MNRRLAVPALLLVFAACAASDEAAPAGTAEAAAAEAAAEITAMLRASAEAWNRGDLDGFLHDYQSARTTTYVGGAGLLRGPDEIRRSYQQGYWGNGRPPQRLGFDDIEVRPLGADHALAVGRYILSEPETGRVTGTGFFSLVLVRTGRRWQIIHDHSSAVAP